MLKRRSLLPLFLAVTITLILTPLAVADISIGFDQDTYSVGLDETFVVQVLFDMDDQTPGYQMPDGGLFSTGILLKYDSTAFQISDPDGLVIPEPLNGNGIGGPPDKLFGAGETGYADAISLAATSGYGGPLLATFNVKAISQGAFTLTLDHFYSSKVNTVDFNGNVLDDQINFGSASVVPKPSTVLLFLGMGLVGFLALRKRRERS